MLYIVHTVHTDLEDDELFRSVQFEDHLAIVAESGEEVGEFSVFITPAQYRSSGECFKVTATSRGTVDGVLCGTMLTAFISKGLLTLEQQHHEYIKVNSFSQCQIYNWYCLDPRAKYV